MPDSTPSNLPPIAVKIANGVFVLGVVLSLFISAYAAYLVIVYFDNNWRGTTFHQISIGVGLIFATLFGFGLLLKDSLKVNLSLVFISVGITLLALILTLELFFGYWFKDNFGHHMHNRRLINIEVTANFNDKDYEFIYKRNFFGFRDDDDTEPKEIDIIFEGGSTADETVIPSHLTIVGRLNRYLKKDNIDLLVGNAGVSGKTTAGYVNDFKNWFPRLKAFDPKLVLFYSGINDGYVFYDGEGRNGFRTEDDNAVGKTLTKKITTYIANNSFILVKLKKIKNAYFELEADWIFLDVTKNYLNKDRFSYIDYETSKTIFSNAPISDDKTKVVNFYKSNLKELKALLTDWNIIPIFITQVKFDGISSHILYLINEETKKFAKDNGYYLIKLDEIYYPDINFEIKDFMDKVHTTPEGSEIMAKIIYKKLKQVIYFEKLISPKQL